MIRAQSPSDRKKLQRLALRKDHRASATGSVTRQGGKYRAGEYRQLTSLRRTGLEENTGRLVPQRVSKGEARRHYGKKASQEKRQQRLARAALAKLTENEVRELQIMQLQRQQQNNKRDSSTSFSKRSRVS